ncbi:MAG: DUF4838 domain-containing protein, partial [Clostridia bacterium]|nr:DUF4838 domain-containing protein [Clostridia bacterium]
VLCMGAFAGCRNNEPEKPVEPEYPIGSENGKPIDPEKPVEFLSTGLAENGKSDYAIVIPKTCGSYAAFAAEEFQDLFSEATGVKLPIITDEGVSWSESAKYISIGATKLFAESGLTCDFATFKQSGARLFTKGNSVMLAGASEEGALYAVYDFLGILFDYEFYDKDAYSLVHKTSVSLPALDFYDIPDFDYRMYGDFQQYDLVGGSAEHAYRLRFRTYGQDYAFDGHASTSIVSEAEYYDEHADWFSAQTGMLGGREYRQLCYTNEGMTAQFIENVKQLLTEKPTTTSISIAQEDVNIWCNCETCSATMERYGNGQPNLGSITQNLFVNKVVKAVDEWLAAEYPGRNMTYMILAYHQSEIAPAHKDENGNYVVNAPELMLPDNVLVQYASIYTC